LEAVNGGDAILVPGKVLAPYLEASVNLTTPTLNLGSAGYGMLYPGASGSVIMGKAYIGTRPICSGGRTMFLPISITHTDALPHSILTTGIGTKVLSANNLQIGSSSQGRLAGVLSCANNMEADITLTFTDSAAVVTSATLSHTFPTSTDVSWTMLTLYTVQSIGVAGVIVYSTQFSYNNGLNSFNGELLTGTIAMNTTLDVVADATITYKSAINASNVFTCSIGNNINTYMP